MCSATLLTRRRKRQSSKISHDFQRGIDTMKITALSNHKPGILNNYIRMRNNLHYVTLIVFPIIMQYIYQLNLY
jgi:hypothetical protein